SGDAQPWSKLQTEIRQLDPKSLRRQNLNARFMDKGQFERLVENVRTDGRLTGAITCYQPEPGAPVEILSGHHRAEAAIAAGVEIVDCVVIVTPLDDQRKKAIQLSHNAVVGKDDPGILSEMYDGLDLFAKKFSGLTDDMLGGFDKVNLAGISTGGIDYQNVSINFLPDDKIAFEESLERISRSKKIENHAAALITFQAFFDTIVRTKRDLNIVNSAIAIATMTELAIERLNQLEGEKSNSTSSAPEAEIADVRDSRAGE
ncbi:MAG: ParB/RepB/Spo0J family partition protein, partial [Beijerinckiaceae bacterium]